MLCRVELYVNTPMLTGWLACDERPASVFQAVHTFRKWRRRIQRKHTIGALMKGSGVRMRLCASVVLIREDAAILAEWHKGDKNKVYDAPARQRRARKRKVTNGQTA